MTQDPKKDPNPFTQLGLTRKLVRELGREQAVKLARQFAKFWMGVYHPDRGGDEEVFQDIMEAKEELDDEKWARAWFRKLLQKTSFDLRKREEKRKIAETEQKLRAATQRYMLCMCSSRPSQMNGTVTVMDGLKRRTLKVEEGTIIRPRALPNLPAGHRVLSAAVVGTIPVAAWLSDLVNSSSASVRREFATGRTSSVFRIDLSAGDDLDPYHILDHLEYCIRPFDHAHESTLVSLYSVEGPEKEENERQSSFWRLEGTIIDWTGTPLAPDYTEQRKPLLTGPDVFRSLGREKFMEQADVLIRLESEGLERRYREDFRNDALAALVNSELKTYKPEQGTPLLFYLKGFVRNLRYKFLRDVVYKEKRLEKGRKRVPEEELEDMRGSSETSRFDAEDFQKLRLAIKGLNETLRPAACLFWVRGKKVPQIAVKLGLPADTVKSRIDEARKVLKKRLPKVWRLL
jgi:RNA polymerase sigma factor (sigma-70 family)